jgi:hypothetical protein
MLAEGSTVVDDLTILEPGPVRAFIHFLDGKDPKTIAAYRGTVRAFVAWLATMPGGDPFRMDLVTAAAIRGYLESLKATAEHHAPRPKPSPRCSASVASTSFWCKTLQKAIKRDYGVKCFRDNA